MSRGDITTKTTEITLLYRVAGRYALHLMVYGDNGDDRNNGKNRRNCGCHDVTLQHGLKFTDG